MSISFSLALVLSVLSYASFSFALKANSWQKRLDRAILDVDGGDPQSRIRNVQRALGDRYFRKDVSKAFRAVQSKGFGKGHPEFIDVLWPRGTVARSDIEGLQGFVTKQLPERWEEVRGYGTEELNGLLRTSISSPLQPNSVLEKVVNSLRDEPDRVVTLAQNALRSTPLGVESPSYEIVETIGGDKEEEEEVTAVLSEPTVEVRRYDAYRAASCELKSTSYSLENMGNGLNRLFSYMVLGENNEKKVMEMTTPFSTKGTTMSVKLPSQYSESPPEPSDIEDPVRIVEVAESTTATLSFPGICTDAEIERRTEILLRVLEEDGTYEAVSGFSVAVLQYNAPGTIPWRRKNEISIPVVEKQSVQISESEEVVVAENEEESPNDVVSEDIDVVSEDVVSEDVDVVSEDVEITKEELNDSVDAIAETDEDEKST